MSENGAIFITPPVRVWKGAACHGGRLLSCELLAIPTAADI